MKREKTTRIGAERWRFSKSSSWIKYGKESTTILVFDTIDKRYLCFELQQCSVFVVVSFLASCAAVDFVDSQALEEAFYGMQVF